jgi:hypothetical protein
MVLEYAKVPVEPIHVDGAALFGLGLDFQGQMADMYYNFSQLRLGDPKGLPYFFAHSDCHWPISHEFSIPFASS